MSYNSTRTQSYQNTERKRSSGGKEMHENYSQMVEDIIEDVRLHEREDEWGRGGK